MKVKKTSLQIKKATCSITNMQFFQFNIQQIHNVTMEFNYHDEKNYGHHHVGECTLVVV